MVAGLVTTVIEPVQTYMQVIGAEPLGTNNMADAAACKSAGACPLLLDTLLHGDSVSGCLVVHQCVRAVCFMSLVSDCNMVLRIRSNPAYRRRRGCLVAGALTQTHGSNVWAGMGAGELVQLPSPPDTIADGLRGDAPAHEQQVGKDVWNTRVCKCIILSKHTVRVQ